MDLFGFETAAVNGFEQLVINYANEKLHQVVSGWTLQKEQEEYVKEGFEWSRVDFFDNSIICSLIEKTNNGGILFLLDEVSLRKPKSYEETDLNLEDSRAAKAEMFLQKMREDCQSNPHLAFPETSSSESGAECGSRRLTDAHYAFQ